MSLGDLRDDNTLVLLDALLDVDTRSSASIGTFADTVEVV